LAPAKKTNTSVPRYKHKDVRPVIYQMLPRLFANTCEHPVPRGPITVNGSGKLNQITATVLQAIRSLGVTHIWYTGVIEHAHDADYTRYGIARHNPYVIKGKAGSPYAITDYYDIDPDLAEDVPNRINEFRALVARTHAAGMGVVIDFVPNHVGRQYASDARPAGAPADFGTGDNTDMFFSPGNDFYYITRQQFAPQSGTGEGTADCYTEFPAKASGNDCFTAFPSVNDWYETVKLNYGVDPWNGSRHFHPIPGVWHKMVHILKYWADMEVDAFRCDMAHMVPVEFWQWVIPQIKAINPHIRFIAEIYDVSLYDAYIGAGFDYLYDKVTLYDTLRGIITSHSSAANITSCWQTLEGKSHRMLTFLENHDEQRYASPQFAADAGTVTPALAVTAAMGHGAVMIYMAQELGEQALDAEGYSGKDGRTTIFDYWSVEKLRRWFDNGTCQGRLTADEQRLHDIYTRILTAVNEEPSLQRGAFFDLMYVNLHNPGLNPHRHYAFIRCTPQGRATMVVANFDNRPADISVTIPAHAMDMLHIPPATYTARDIISGKTLTLTMAADAPCTVSVGAHSAAMATFSFRANDNGSSPDTPKNRSQY